MAAIQKVVLLGASGTLGSAILHALRDKGSFDTTVLSRVESPATFPADVKVTKTNYQPHELQQAFQGSHAVISATGLGAMSQQRDIIDACVAAGVYRFVTNDFGNPHEFKGLPELEWARTPKLEILEYVKQQAAQHTNFTWTALATGHFLDYAIKKFPAFGFDLAERSARLVDGGDEPFSSTTLEDIGQAVAGILQHPQETANRYLLVRTLETRQNDILKALEEQTQTKWKVEHITSEELMERGRMKQSKGERAILEFLPVQIFEKGAGRYDTPKEQYDNALLGVTEKSVDQVMEAVLASS